MNDLYNKLKKFKFIILYIGLILISIIILLWQQVFSASVTITVAPTSSIIKIGNNVLKAGTHKLTPGKYNISVEKEGFETKTQSITVARNETKKVYFILTSNNPSTANWYEENPEDQLTVEYIGSQKFDQGSQDWAKNYPIIEKLPYETANYSIGYGSCDDIGFCIVIDAAPGIRNIAIKRFIQVTGENPADYYFKFIDYINPFLGEG